MFKRFALSGCWVGLLCACAAGCEEPQIITSAEPGVDARTTFQPKEEPAEALGEAVATKSTASAPKPQIKTDVPLATSTAKGETKTTPSGVVYETLVEGTGAVAQPGQTLSIHYTGTLDDGRQFDSSRTRNKPFTVTISTGSVIKGWDEAIPGMKVGERRKLTIPPNAGYGALGSKPAIPPNATLHFDVELMDAK